MIKMSRAKRTDNDYRFEMLEKRMDTLERLILSKNDNNLTQDLLQLVLSMMKNNNNLPSSQPLQTLSKKQQEAEAEKEQEHAHEAPPASDLDKSKMGFYRRVSIM